MSAICGGAELKKVTGARGMFVVALLLLLYVIILETQQNFNEWIDG